MTAATQDRSARLQFLSDWRILQSGELTAGGVLTIEYDPGRLPSFRKSFRGADLWNMEVYLAFHPGDRVEKASVLEELRAANGLVIDHRPKPVEVAVPREAVQAELWFRTFDDVDGFREAWDSRFGDNYWFAVANGQSTGT